MDGQQVLFNYNAYNENGGKIDSSYNKKQPAQTRLGTKGLIPGDVWSWVSNSAGLHLLSGVRG